MKPKFLRTIHPSGYPIVIEIEEDDPKLEVMIDQLNRWGFRPDVAGDGWVRTPEGDPFCPKHKTIMYKREKQGDTWHSHAVIDDNGEKLYCKGYPGEDSPGYNVPNNAPAAAFEAAPAAAHANGTERQAVPSNTDATQQANDDLFSD